MKTATSLILGIGLLVCSFILGRAYTYKYRAQDTVVVTGLGEETFESDLIVWSGAITSEADNTMAGYARIEQSKEKVVEFLKSKGVDTSTVIFGFVNTEKQYESVYNNGNWAGQRFTGYRLAQTFTIESHDIDLIETVSREISSLIARGVAIEASAPSYYYTRLEDVKLGLIEKASANARLRAEKIAENAGMDLGKVASARQGVIQITGANSNEEFSAGGSFNTSSRIKKARITMKIEFRIK